jgi:uncharacterized zinc-type alcohol dehydrogenase-like protein
MAITAYAAKAAGKPLEKFQYEPDELGPFDIEVKITHCGICHSDIHLIDNDWQMSQYPLIAGHEIIGTVAAKGRLVTGLEKGQRVGIGWQRTSCLNCDLCQTGYENLCLQNEATCMGHHGGFAHAIRADSRFAYDIPEELDSQNAGPLLCAGITVYSPLRHYDVKPRMKVGVIGIGGLGHLALQYARAMGCEVTAFSSSADKETEARSFGAHRFIPSNSDAELGKAANSLDFIISTVYTDLNWPAYINILKPNGRLCFVGAVTNPISVPTFPLVLGQKNVSGSVIGGRKVMREMLEFSVRHGITTKAELYPIDQVNVAIDRVKQNKVKYRAVVTV